MSTEADMSPAEERRQAIIRTATELTREAFGERFDEIERAAADAAADTTDDEDAKPPVGKLTITFEWFSGQERPELEAKATYSIRRTLKLSAPTDRGDELPFSDKDNT